MARHVRPGTRSGRRKAPASRPASPEPAAPAELVEPARYASKGDWVDYAVRLGAGRQEAEASTKEVLIQAYGTRED